MTIKPMRVDNVAFLMDKLGSDLPPTQVLRELIKNAIDAVQRRQTAGIDPNIEGRVVVDVDWPFLEQHGYYKLQVGDNGDGLTKDEINSYLNHLSCSGANGRQAITGNFGFGARIAGMFRNPAGMLYRTWKASEEHGNLALLQRDDERAVYGLKLFPDAENPPHETYAPEIENSQKPSFIESSGTLVTLLGNSADDNTLISPETGAINWVINYLDGRFFRIPTSVTLNVRKLTRDAANWPTKRPSAGDKTYNLQVVKGADALYSGAAEADSFGILEIDGAKIHWWIVVPEAAHSLTSRGLRTGAVLAVYQDEVYMMRYGRSGRAALANFGIVFGASQVVLAVEIEENVAAPNLGRNILQIDGAEVDQTELWASWAEFFKGNMPDPIKQLQAKIMSDTDTSKESLERIRERLNRIAELLNHSRYRRDPNGEMFANGRIVGKGGHGEQQGEPGGGARRRRGKGPGVIDDFLASIVKEGGVRVSPVVQRTVEPEVVWVSRDAGTRDEDEGEDMAAWFAGEDPIGGNLLKLSRDFRGYRDLFNHLNQEYNSENMELKARRIRDAIEEWMEQQAIEVVMAVRNLANGSTWDDEVICKALSAEALTAVLLCRYHLVNQVKRAIGSLKNLDGVA